MTDKAIPFGASIESVFFPEQTNVWFVSGRTFTNATKNQKNELEKMNPEKFTSVEWNEIDIIPSDSDHPCPYYETATPWDAGKIYSFGSFSGEKNGSRSTYYRVAAKGKLYSYFNEYGEKQIILIGSVNIIL